MDFGKKAPNIEMKTFIFIFCKPEFVGAPIHLESGTKRKLTIKFSKGFYNNNSMVVRYAHKCLLSLCFRIMRCKEKSITQTAYAEMAH